MKCKFKILVSFIMIVSMFTGCRRCKICERTVIKTYACMPSDTSVVTFEACGKDLTDVNNTRYKKSATPGDSTYQEYTKCGKN